MSGETARLKLAELPEGQAMNAAEINMVLGQLDALVDCCLKGVFVDAAPVSPGDGDVYLVGGSPSGDWGAEYTYKLACRRDGAWEPPVIPFDGMRAFVPGTGAFLVYCDGVWTDWNSLIGAAETSIASAATCDIGAAGALFVAVTGTTAITSFGAAANKLRFLRFAGALTLNHDATALILPGGANIVTAAGDCAFFASDGDGNWRCRHYQRASGIPVPFAATGSGALVLSDSPAFTGAASAATLGLSGNLNLANNSGVQCKDIAGTSRNGLSLDTGNEWRLGDTGVNGGFHFSNSLGGSDFFTLTNSGNVLLGTSTDGGWHGNAKFAVYNGSTTSALSVWNSVGGSNAIDARIEYTNSTYIQFWYGTTPVGAINPNGASGVTYATTSDARLKTVLAEQTDYRAAIRALWVGDFTWKESGAPGFGVLAQQAYDVMPNHQGVTRPGDAEATWSASAEPFAHLALWGVKDLYVMVEALAARVAALEAAHAAG